MRLLKEVVHYNDLVIVTVTHFGRRSDSSAMDIYSATTDSHVFLLSYIVWSIHFEVQLFLNQTFKSLPIWAASGTKGSFRLLPVHTSNVFFFRIGFAQPADPRLSSNYDYLCFCTLRDGRRPRTHISFAGIPPLELPSTAKWWSPGKPLVSTFD